MSLENLWSDLAMKKLLAAAMLFLLPLANSFSAEVKGITGTWINLAWQDVRNKYTNMKTGENTDPAMWKSKVEELHAMGVEYLVFMAVANEGMAYYPSSIMPWAYPRNRQSPVSAIMETAERLGMKVFMSTGWAVNQDDNLKNRHVKARQIEIMQELASLYGDSGAFYGWYLPVEDCLAPVLSSHAVSSVNSLAARAREFKPDARIMISPYGIFASVFSDPVFAERICSLDVDIIAYQDEIGCAREPFPLIRLRENWKKLREIHDRCGIQMWANCETFTWEAGTNSRQSALVPAAFERILSQLVAASDAGVDCIVSFMLQGIIEDPASQYSLGQPIWSNVVYADYLAWKSGDPGWKYLEASLQGRLSSGNSDACNVSHGALFDGCTATENSFDKAWVHFPGGTDTVTFETGEVGTVIVRYLDFRSCGIFSPDAVSLSVSDNGEDYRLVERKTVRHFPNDRHDAWIGQVVFSGPEICGGCLKLTLEGSGKMLLDEIFLDPVISVQDKNQQ